MTIVGCDFHGKLAMTLINDSARFAYFIFWTPISLSTSFSNARRLPATHRLGTFLLIAARRPLEHRILILFAGWSTLARAKRFRWRQDAQKRASASWRHRREPTLSRICLAWCRA
jgi:hypothetical protein